MVHRSPTEPARTEATRPFDGPPFDDVPGMLSMLSGRWLSVHFFFAGDIYGPDGDHLLLKGVAPLARAFLRRGWVERYFFLRYREDGPHLRLRLRGRPQTLIRRVAPAVDRLAEDPAWTDAGLVRLAFVPYEAELRRYGGPAATALAERLFQVSSETATDLLGQIDPGARQQRLGKGLLAMLVLLQVFVRRRRPAVTLARHYGQAFLAGQIPDPDQRNTWQRRFAEACRRQETTLGALVVRAWQTLETGGDLPPTLALYRQELQGLGRRLRNLARGGRLQGDASSPGRTPIPWQQASASLVPSYLHMMNNRLGIDPREEAYLAMLIAHNLGET